MTPLARRLGFALTVGAAGAAGVVSLLRSTASAVAAGCRTVGRTEHEVPWRGGARLLDRSAGPPRPLP